MKNVKISLLAAGATLALLACSSLEVDNPEEENFPADWSVVEYIKANPDLRALQIMDQVSIWNATKGFESDEDAFLADTALMTDVALKFAGFTETSLDFADKDKMKFLKSFNMYGVTDERVVLDTLTLDSIVFEKQFVVYGAVEGRPYRLCADTETSLVKKGECQSDEATSVGYVAHLYCSKSGVVYCIDCEATDECPEIIVPEESSSSAAAPDSSAEAGDSSSSGEATGDSSSSGEVTGDSSSSGEATGDSSSSGEVTGDSSSSETAVESSSSAV